MNIPDIQAQSDNRMIRIDKVGVKGIKYPIVVEDRANGSQQTIADWSLYVELQHSRRGTHMSRFVEILNNYHRDTIINQLDALLSELKQVHDADAAFIDLRFPYFINRPAPVSGISSLMDYQCFFSASYRDQFEFWIGARVPVTTLCPCSREISVYGAHNQRSYITIRVRYSELVWLEELIAIAENAASSPVYPLLKRSDEKYVTEKAYENPKFVEDVVREITAILESDHRIIEFTAESDSIESIHNHNAYAFVYRNNSTDPGSNH